jgi:dihydropteroate synthase type 2
MTGLMGIVNITRDSFSDGGRWFDPENAIAHAEALAATGADVIDLGAESTHPDAEDVPAAIEIERLLPVVDALVARGLTVSVDTRKPEVMRAMGARGAHWLNDVSGFRTEAAVRAAAECEATLCVMFARQEDGRASRDAKSGDAVREAMVFFEGRIDALQRAGVKKERIVLDPGMGFFLGPDAETSFDMLRRIGDLRAFGLPLLVSCSRKSFLGAVTGRPVNERGPASLAAELYAARHGVAWIRTHDVRSLKDALRVQEELEPRRGS